MAFHVDEKYIEKTESGLGVRFPESFRNKIMRLNGGITLSIGKHSERSLPVFLTLAHETTRMNL